MKPTITLLLTGLIGLLIQPANVNAEEYHLGFRIAPRISTLGGGLEVAQGVTPWLGLRAGANYFTYGYEATESDVDYDLDLELKSFGLFADIHPFKQAFRLSVGFLINGNAIDGTGKITNSVEIGDKSYDSNEIKSILLDVSFNTFAPYVGLGFDTTFGDEDNWGFTFDLGVMFSGAPEAKLSVQDTFAANSIQKTTLNQDINKEEQSLQNDLDAYEFYPVLSTGIVYQF